MPKRAAIFIATALVLTGLVSLLPAKLDFRLVPESERGLRACVIGLDPSDGEYFGLPTMDQGLARSHGWDRTLFWIDFELSHGHLMKILPPEAKVFVGVPALKGKTHWTRTRDHFLGYLRQRCGWDDARIKEKIRFFTVRDTLIWAQDFSFQVGLAPGGQRLFHVGPEDAAVYRGFAEDLTRQHPDTFRMTALPRGVSGEGGDLALVRRGDGNVSLIIGRHRVEHYFKVMGRPWSEGQRVAPEDLEEVERAYGTAFGLPAMICPKQPLLEGWGTDELFHLDMVTSFMSGPRPGVVVPEMSSSARNGSNGQPLDPALIKLCQREYAAVAKELAAAGFIVRRAPLADHPARSPTNAIKYRSIVDQRKIVLLARYPKAPAKGEDCGLQKTLDGLNAVAGDIHQRPSDDQVRAMTEALDQVWVAMKACDDTQDGTFESQAKAYRQGGYDVVAVPSYPWGAGSLHCQFLH